jgi:hypothetical protein
MSRHEDLARHILDALDKPADDPETRAEQVAITQAIEGFLDETQLVFVSDEPEDKIGTCVLAIREAAQHLRAESDLASGWPSLGSEAVDIVRHARVLLDVALPEVLGLAAGEGR